MFTVFQGFIISENEHWWGKGWFCVIIHLRATFNLRIFMLFPETLTSSFSSRIVLNIYWKYGDDICFTINSQGKYKLFLKNGNIWNYNIKVNYENFWEWIRLDLLFLKIVRIISYLLLHSLSISCFFSFWSHYFYDVFEQVCISFFLLLKFEFIISFS